ncbi:Leu/Phe/Val dehydrogenase [Neptuniibacter halophilus]|uniref:Leu/Phe/Val dehydrogenase n=1 Tax=Neptuniibacter halophilus TaxID=651666 RepID=UPI00257463EC|nr:amino acid dehydrogenase [Neptuniibacter halophilus]
MFKQMESNATQRLHFCHDPDTGLRAIIAIHSTVRGPAIGGCRFIPYASDEDAITDALRLARGMSYKAALSGLPHGGAKAVLIQPEEDFDRAALMQSFGRFVDTLGGDYITAMDSGTQISDMDQINQSTPFVTCTSDIGDPSPNTALGVFEGIKASARFKLNRNSLRDLTVSIQGLGHVGYEVARLLHQAGARLIVADIDPQRVQLCEQNFNARSVAAEEIYAADADIFCPCGLGAILNDHTIPQLRVAVVAGSANNQLAEEQHGEQLLARDILYAPDYLINAGGLIFVALQYAKRPATEIRRKVTGIGDALFQLYQEAQQCAKPVHRIANQRAEAIIQAAKFNSAA